MSGFAKKNKAVCDRCGFFGYNTEMELEPGTNFYVHKRPCSDGIWSNSAINPLNQDAPWRREGLPPEQSRPDSRSYVSASDDDWTPFLSTGVSAPPGV